jgi:ribosomal-protein-alanine N-acetyltransferase
MSILISDATINDLDALYNIEKECFTLEAFTKELIATLLQRPDSISLLAKIKGEIVGFAIALIHQRKNRKVGHIFTIDVAARARKGGVGLVLMKNVEQKLIEKGAKSCYLEVRVDNTAARKLYKKLGYSERMFVKDFYYLGGDCIVMRKNLQ